MVTFEIQTDLERLLEDATAQIMRDFEKEAPPVFKESLGNPPPSKRGSHPAKRSGNLQRTLTATLTAPDTVEMSFESYAQYLDSIFGGELGRDFIEEDVVRALSKL